VRGGRTVFVTNSESVRAKSAVSTCRRVRVRARGRVRVRTRVGVRARVRDRVRTHPSAVRVEG
jgi:hypothetical protein